MKPGAVQRTLRDQLEGPSFFWTCACVALLGILFIGVRWNTFTAPFERDEGEYAYSAWLMRHDGVPYRDAFMQKPPMIVYTYLAGQLIGGDSVWVPRVLAALFLGGATAGLAAFARLEIGKGAGLVAAWIATPMFTLPALVPFAANTEAFMLLPLMMTLLLYARHRGRAGGIEWFAAGCSAVVSLMYKPIDVYLLFFVASVWVAETWIESRDPMRVARLAACGFAGGTVVAIGVLAWFLAKDGGRSFWEAVVRFNVYYSRSGAGTFAALAAQMKILWPSWWIVLILPGWLLIRRWPRWWFHLGLAAASLLGIYQSWHGHYYLLWVPFLAVAATAAIQSIGGECEKRWGPVVARAWVLGFSGVVVLVCLMPARGLVTLAPDELTVRLYGSGNPFVESREVAARVASLTRGDAYVYVAGSEPQILYYARRRSATRFVIAYPLMIDTPFAAVYQNEAVEDLTRHPPAVVVVARSPFSWLRQSTSPEIFFRYLTNLLDREYRLVGGWLPERSGWQEPLTGELVNRCSLLVFQRTR